MMKKYIQIITSIEKKEDAEKLVKVLIERRLAGCAQVIGPVVSIYWWNDNITKAEEWLCFIKSRKDLYKEIEKIIKEINQYEIPEIIALPIIGGSKEYLNWLCDELKETKKIKRN